MVRIIAPACLCVNCDAGQMKIIEMAASFKPTTKLDPIDINLAKWHVVLACDRCGHKSLMRINDVKAPLGYVEPAKVKE